MNKILKYLMTTMLVCIVTILSIGCGCKDPQGILVVTPDGAPALSISKLMYEENELGEDVTYKVINAETLPNQVANQIPDVAILPLNAATKLCRDNYKIVGVNTHGNLYMLGTQTITDINNLIGKKVAVIQYDNVPGLTFRAVLDGNNIPYTRMAEIDTQIDSTKVNIYGCSPNAIEDFFKYEKFDYALTAEPNVTVLCQKLATKNIKVCLDLQQSYQSTFGKKYPQAVTIIKTSLINENPKFVKKFIEAMKSNNSFLVEENIEKILSAISSHLEEGLAASLNNKKLTKNSLINSNVKFVEVETLKADIKNYIENIKKVDSTKISEVADSIFYSIK